MKWFERTRRQAALTVRCPVLFRHMEPQSCRDEFKLLFLVDVVCACARACQVRVGVRCSERRGVNAP